MIEFSVEQLPIEPTLTLGEISLFNLKDSIKLIECCKLHNISILGFDGFKVVCNQRRPDMDCIVDFSASLNEEYFSEKSLEASKRIIKSLKNADILLEFVLVKI